MRLLIFFCCGGAVATVAGCVYSPEVGDGRIQCAPDGLCPDGFACAVDGRCYRPGAAGDLGASLDGGPPDLFGFVPASCKTLLELIPGAPSGPYTIAPDGATLVKVYCDMLTNGGGWTVVSINGDLTANACVHRIRDDAPACGAAPDLLTDWQLPGPQQRLISFTQVLFNAYGPPGEFYAAVRLDVAATTVGSGVLTGTPMAINNAPIMCAQDNTVALRTRVAVNPDGYTYWGRSDGNCPNQLGRNLGLNVPNSGGGRDFPGWDDDDDSCGCGNQFTPADLGARRGFYALR